MEKNRTNAIYVCGVIIAIVLISYFITALIYFGTVKAQEIYCLKNNNEIMDAIQKLEKNNSNYTISTQCE